MIKASEQSDKNLIQRAATNVADVLTGSVDAVVLGGVPALSGAWALAKALLGNALDLRQQRALEFVEAINNDPSTFTQEIVSSEAFQDGFVIALTEYIKIRNFLKRRIALKIFKEFTASGDKVEFPLERFYDTLSKLSTSGIKTLGFIKSEILPMREQGIKDDLATKNLGTEKPYEWWYEQNLKSEPVSTYFNQWIYDRYHPRSKAVKDSLNNGEEIQDTKLLGEVFDVERDISERMNAPLAELEYLGLIKWVNDPKNGGLGWGGGGATAWALTSFAYEFIEFIEDAPETPTTDAVI